MAILDRSYPSTELEPIWPDPARFRPLAAFVRDPALTFATERFREGAVLSYHRVGDTPLVVVLRTPYPWPLRLLLDPRLRGPAVAALALLAFVPLFFVARRAVRFRSRPSTGPEIPQA
jgi:hypothetical protein